MLQSSIPNIASILKGEEILYLSDPNLNVSILYNDIPRPIELCGIPLKEVRGYLVLDNLSGGRALWSQNGSIEIQRKGEVIGCIHPDLFYTVKNAGAEFVLTFFDRQNRIIGVENGSFSYLNEKAVSKHVLLTNASASAIKLFPTQEGEVEWQLNLSSLADLSCVLSSDLDAGKPIRFHGEFQIWKDDLILSIGSLFNQRLISISLLDGSVNWVQNDIPATPFFRISEEYAYWINGQILIKLKMANGDAEILDISEQIETSGFQPSDNFSVGSHFLCFANFRSLQIGLFNLDSQKFSFTHSFVPDRDIQVGVHQLGVPEFQLGRLIVLDSSDTLHLFDIDSIA